MVPGRDQLFITGSDDEAGLALILKRAEEGYREAARPLCPLPLCLDDDQWVESNVLRNGGACSVWFRSRHEIGSKSRPQQVLQELLG